MQVVIDRTTVNINQQKVLRDLGYDARSKPPARMRALVNEYSANINQIIAPSYSYVTRDIDFVQGRYTFLEGGLVFESKVIARLLEQCEQITAFTITIGECLEETVGQIADDGFILRARVLDAIGSDAIEKVADTIQDRTRWLAAAEGLTVSRRFSPGYCDWPINQQRILFNAMNDDTAGINLTEECVMVPHKSISGIIGMGTPENNIEHYNPCETCHKQGCDGRR